LNRQLKCIGFVRRGRKRYSPFRKQLDEIGEHDPRQLLSPYRIWLIARQRQPDERSVRSLDLNGNVTEPKLAVRIEIDRMTEHENGLVVYFIQDQSLAGSDGPREICRLRRAGYRICFPHGSPPQCVTEKRCVSSGG